MKSFFIQSKSQKMTWTTETTFQSKIDGIKIKYAAILHKDGQTTVANALHSDEHRPCIVLLTGWAETFYKYEWLLKDMFDRGFNIFTVDHLNQGFSEDTPGTWYRKGNKDGSGRRICHIDDFDKHYVIDVLQFLRNIVRPTIGSSLSLCLVSHSMGGLIATRVAQLQEERIVD